MNYETLMQSSGYRNKEIHKRLGLKDRAGTVELSDCVRKLALDILFEKQELRQEVKRLFDKMKLETNTNKESIIAVLCDTFLICRKTVQDWVL